MSAPTPAWLTSLIEAAEKYGADVANGRKSTALTCPHLEYTKAEDREHPERICAWCFHPRNSAECNFAQQHTPYVEMFGFRGNEPLDTRPPELWVDQVCDAVGGDW